MARSSLARFTLFCLVGGCWWSSFAWGQQRCDINDTTGELNCSFRGVRRSIIPLNDNYTAIVTSVNLSGNKITEIEQLYRYPNVRLLNLRSNSIRNISNDTFINVTKLENLDLSVNQIRTIEPFLFSENKQLTTLDLHGNILQLWKNKPLLCSSSIRILDLSHCGLITVTKENFMCLPGVVTINLNYNLFNSLSPEVFSFMPSLTSLALRDNPFHCSCDLVILANWIRSKNTDLSTSNPMCDIPFKERITLEEAKAKVPLNCNATESAIAPRIPQVQQTLPPRNDSTAPEVDYIFISYEMDFRAPAEDPVIRKSRIISGNLYLAQTIVPIILLILVVATWVLVHRLFWSAKRVSDNISISSYDSGKGLLPMFKEDHTYVQVK